MINHPKAPAALVECGFMTNQKEAALLKSDDYRTKVANALVSAFASHFGLVKVQPAPTPVTPAKPTPSVTGKLYKVQVGAFSKKENADALIKDLAVKGFKGAVIYE
jgi:N-acetylmuramoyl-L-alanine amidase